MRYAKKLFSPVTSNWITWSRAYEAELHEMTNWSNSISGGSEYGSEPDSENESSEISSEPEIGSTDDFTGSEKAAEGRDDKKRTLAKTDLGSQRQANAADLRSKVSNPMYYAACLGLTDIIKSLHAQGLDCNENGGDYGNPLQAAILKGQHAAVEILLELGADVTCQGEEHNYAIFVAADAGLEAVFQLLIKAGADFEVQDEHGMTCFHVASSSGAIAIVKWLLDSRMDVDALTADELTTPLYWACHEGHGEVVRLLLRYGTNANHKTMSGSFPLYIATKNGHLEVLKALLTDGVADVNLLTGDSDATCLHLAARMGYEEITQLLLTHKVDPNAEDNEGWSALHLAAGRGHTSIAQLLLEHGAHVNCEGRYGWTPLHSAAAGGSCSTSQLLLNHGAKVDAEDWKGRNVIDLAAFYGLLSLEIVELLVQQSGAFGTTNNDLPLQLEASSSGRVSNVTAHSNTSEKVNEHSLSGKWLGTYTYMGNTTYRKGEQEPTEFYLPLEYETSPAAENILKGQGKDNDGDFQIWGQLLDKKTIHFV